MRQRRSTLQRQTDAFRQKVIAMEAESTRLLSATYADALKVLEPRIVALSGQIAAAQAAGETVNVSWLFQQERYQELRRQLITLMDQYGQTAKVITTEAQKVIVRESLQHAGQTLLSVSGGSGEEIATLARGWAAVPDSSVIELVGAIQDGTPVDAVIRSYGTDSVQAVQQALTRGLALGDSAQMTTQVIRALGVTRARAESLVRTETMRAARSATMAAYEQSGVVTMVRWSASLSARTCSACFPAGTLVSGPKVKKGFARHYRGDVIVIETASGKRLTATPNHPILTSAGWVAAEFLNVGSEVMTERFSDGAQLGINVDNGGAPTAIEKVFESLPVVLAEMPCAAPDFHGDGKGSDVYVVRSNGLLWSRRYSETAQLHEDTNFTLGVTGIFPGGGFGFPALSHSATGIPTERVVPIAVGENDLSRLERHFGGANSSGFFERSKRGFGVLQAGVHSLPRTTQRFRKFKHTFSAKITTLDLGIINPNSAAVLLQMVGAFCERLFRCAPQSAPINLLPQPIVANSAHASSDYLGDSRDIRGNSSLNIPSRRSFFDGARRNAMSSQGRSGSVVGDMEVLHQSVQGLPSDIARDEIVSIYRDRFSGHVYNLETGTGWYGANGIIVHNCLEKHGKLFPLGDVPPFHVNCRCNISPYNPKWSDEWQSGESWLREQPVNVQEAILGHQGRADWAAGNVTLDDFVKVTHSKDWGDAFVDGGVEWARKQATKAGRAPSEWATAPPITRTATKPKPTPKKSSAPAKPPVRISTLAERLANEQRRQELLSQPMVEFTVN